MDIKAGYKTTEFWITALTTGWAIFGAAVPPPWNAVLPVVAGGIYTIARGLAKGGVIKGAVGQGLAQ